ncbi:MAG: GIY-YIG nuclease family protein [Rikenellaceae bacterium]
MSNNNNGIVYVLTNSAMPGLVKIGMTTRNDIDQRMRELYSTGVPVPFECVYACEVPTCDCAKIESALHKAFDPHRVNKNREFFAIDTKQVIPILQVLDRKDITAEVSTEIGEKLTIEDKIASEKIKITKRPPFNFREMNIPIGSTLTFANDSSVQVTVIADRRVSYNGEDMALTAITTQLLGASKNVAPTRYWEFDGRNLRDIYDETYTLDE